MTQFESKYVKLVNIVSINVDEKTTPEFRQYGELLKRTRGIPFTLWVDGSGKVLGEEIGGMDAKELSKKTAEYMLAAGRK